MTASITPSKNERTQGDEKRIRSNNSTVRDYFSSSKNANVTPSQQGAGDANGEFAVNMTVKTNLVNKRVSATKRAARRIYAKAMTPTSTSPTKPTTTRKAAISFADQQKDKTWKYKLVVSFSIKVIFNKEGTKAGFDAKLGKVLTFLREIAGNG